MKKSRTQEPWNPGRQPGNGRLVVVGDSPGEVGVVEFLVSVLPGFLMNRRQDDIPMDDVNIHRSWWPNLARIQVGVGKSGHPSKPRQAGKAKPGGIHVGTPTKCEPGHPSKTTGQMRTGTPIRNSNLDKPGHPSKTKNGGCPKLTRPQTHAGAS